MLQSVQYAEDRNLGRRDGRPRCEIFHSMRMEVLYKRAGFMLLENTERCVVFSCCDKAAIAFVSVPVVVTVPA